MNEDLIQKYELIQKYDPKLKLILTDRLGIIYNNGVELFRTWGPNATNTIDTYLDGMLQGMLLGMKYFKNNSK